MCSASKGNLRKRDEQVLSCRHLEFHKDQFCLWNEGKASRYVKTSSVKSVKMCTISNSTWLSSINWTPQNTQQWSAGHIQMPQQVIWREKKCDDVCCPRKIINGRVMWYRLTWSYNAISYNLISDWYKALTVVTTNAKKSHHINKYSHF